MEKAPEAFRTISEVATELDVPQHVLRFWEGKFAQVRPMKRGGGRRYYRPEDIELLRGIRQLLYGDGFTIRGVQKILREQGIRYVSGVGSGEIEAAPPSVSAPAQPAPSAPKGAPPAPANDDDLSVAAEAAGLSQEQVRLLQASLYELAEIKKTLDEAGE